ncbi:MAG: hypothetical protein ALAOOOJD_00272 [bacterium]|nr:hypothetical protein [bacterium]
MGFRRRQHFDRAESNARIYRAGQLHHIIDGVEQLRHPHRNEARPRHGHRAGHHGFFRRYHHGLPAAHRAIHRSFDWRGDDLAVGFRRRHDFHRAASFAYVFPSRRLHGQLDGESAGGNGYKNQDRLHHGKTTFHRGLCCDPDDSQRPRLGELHQPIHRRSHRVGMGFRRRRHFHRTKSHASICRAGNVCRIADSHQRL